MSGLGAVVLAIACCLAAVVAFVSGPRELAAATAATCSYEERQAHASALRTFRRSMVSARSAYFRKHESRAARAAFVRRQHQRLRALRTAAACTVSPVAPGSAATCAFMLAANEEEMRSNTAQPNEGPTKPGWGLRSIGAVRGIVLMLDFPDAQGERSAAGIASAYAPDLQYFGEASYGRLSVSVDAVDRWIRMPQPSTAYGVTTNWQRTYFGDAITAADPWVDFSRYDFVIVAPTRRWLGRNQGWSNRPGHGIATAEGEVRFGAAIAADMTRFGARVVTHELMHAFGLPDVYFGDGSPGTWDPMSMRSEGGTPMTHLLGWHKRKLGWIDPSQITCVETPGVVEETLTPIATAGGRKLVLVPTSASTTYVVEARRRLGYDREICDEGILVYDVDSQLRNAEVRNGRGLLNVKGPTGCGTPFGAFPFQTGDVYEDAVVKVEVLARDANAFRVRVTRK